MHWLAIIRYAEENGIVGVTFDTVQNARKALRMPAQREN